MSILWTIIIGFIVGVIAKFIMPGDNTEPKGFILTSILGIVGAFVATYLGQSGAASAAPAARADHCCDRPQEAKVEKMMSSICRGC